MAPFVLQKCVVIFYFCVAKVNLFFISAKLFSKKMKLFFQKKYNIFKLSTLKNNFFLLFFKKRLKFIFFTKRINEWSKKMFCQ